jgi:hypothetical protein
LGTEEKRGTSLEAAQMKFLRHLLGITKLDKERINVLGEKNWGTEHNEGNKTVPESVATTRTEDGQKQNTKQALQYRPKGRRNIRRPRKRWRDQLHLED